jgi:hypothetical protein
MQAERITLRYCSQVVAHKTTANQRVVGENLQPGDLVITGKNLAEVGSAQSYTDAPRLVGLAPAVSVCLGRLGSGNCATGNFGAGSGRHINPLVRVVVRAGLAGAAVFATE